MRILHVLDHSLPVQSGYAFRSAAILREQGRLGWSTIPLTGPKQGGGSALAEMAGGIEFLRTAPGGSFPERVPIVNQVEVVRRLRARLREVIAAERPDVVHAHSPCLNGLAALGLGVPFVYELRSSWEDAAVSSGTTREGSVRYRLSRWLETQVLRRADAVVTICEGLRADVLSRGVPNGNITVVPNAVDPEEFSRPVDGGAAVRERLGLGGCYVLGFLGSFFAWEGLSLLIEALPAIIAQRPDVRLLLVGGGREEAELRRAVERLSLGEVVVFAGQAPHSEVGAFYDAVDLLVYPRLPMRLTEMVTPLKPLEAMAMGKVHLASDVGGHRELVRDRDTGRLFRAGDRAALADAVLELSRDMDLQQRIRTRGPAFVRDERTWRHVVPRYADVYDRIRTGAAR